MKKKNYYHYTSIENLSLILSSKKIKFSRLDKVNDLTEAETEDLGKMGHFFFVSCWTDQKEESIPFWNMYTNDMKGVRIELPYPMLYEYKNDSIVQNIFYRNDKNTYMLAYDGFEKVNYTNDDSLRIQKLLNTLEDGSGLSDYNPMVGLIKKKIWSFESEWRYKIKSFETNKIYDESFNLDVTRSYVRKDSHSDLIESLFFDLDETSFKRMKIRLGPKTTLAEKIIIEALIAKFNPDATLEPSELNNVIR